MGVLLIESPLDAGEGTHDPVSCIRLTLSYVPEAAGELILD